MPRRQLLSSSEKATLFDITCDETVMIRITTINEQDLAIINQHRTDANRLGFAVNLCYLRAFGFALDEKISPDEVFLRLLSNNLKIPQESWLEYAERYQTRWEHLTELYAYLSLHPFSSDDSHAVLIFLTELATQTDKGITLAEAMIAWLQQRNCVIPNITVIDRICSEALSQGSRRVYSILCDALSDDHKASLSALLDLKEDGKITVLNWLRKPPKKSSAKHVLLHLERLKVIESINLPYNIDTLVHQNRLLKLARIGNQMLANDLSKLENTRRFATLVAVVTEARSTIIDEIIDLHDKIIGRVFNQAKRLQNEKLQQSSKSIQSKLQHYVKVGKALLNAKAKGIDPFAAIEDVLPWVDFEASVNEAISLAKKESFDFLPLVNQGYMTLRKYAPEMLNILKLRATPSSQGLTAALEMLVQLNDRQARKVPEDAPTKFIPNRWDKLVFTDEGIDRRFYEICALSELRSALRSGDIWVQGSRQYKDFDGYLMPASHFENIKANHELPLNIEQDCKKYLEMRLNLLSKQLTVVNHLAATEQLPDASISISGLHISPLDKAVPIEAILLINQLTSMLPHIKITELLSEVDSWTDFTKHFTHLKNDKITKDKNLLLAIILADGINLGLTKMAESCPSATYSKMATLQAWHVRDETYASGLAELINAQKNQPLSNYWGDGTTSSSDGQNFKVGGLGKFAGRVNLKYGQEPGVQFYTHISDQYSPYYIQPISATIRDSTYVLDGLLYHESDLKIEEHYTDTAGFTDHVFALMNLLGFRFAPRIRDLNDKRLYIPKDGNDYPALQPLIGQKINIKLIETHWNEILRLATSIKKGTVTASLILRKLGSYPKQNGLAKALRELGRIERTLFMLEWIKNDELRRKVQVGLNKGESRNSLAKAVFFNRLGEIRDRSFEQQRYKASGLNLITAAIILWNTVYLNRAIQSVKAKGLIINEELFRHVSPLGWEHINLTGDYIWDENGHPKKGEFRPLRSENN